MAWQPQAEPSKISKNQPQEPVYQLLKVKNTILIAELADTNEARTLGLSRRQSLISNEGMLFIFPASDYHSFWMKEMNFPLDIIWFDHNRQVVDLATDVAPEGLQPKNSYRPRMPARYALEVNAGWVASHELELGDNFIFCDDPNCGYLPPLVEPVLDVKLPIAPDMPIATSEDAIAVKSATPTPSIIKLTVPFTSQAPFGNWADPREQDGCEEASILMAARWVKNQGLNLEEALTEILALSKYQEEKFGYYQDTNAVDTAQLLKDYYQVANVKVATDVSIEAIKKKLAEGSLVITPMNGQILRNPNYTAPGPERHMILIIGYDDSTQEFITNDSGTRRGAGFRYDYDNFFESIRDYPSGADLPFTGREGKAMIVVGR